MRSRVLFLDHVGALGGAELSLVDVARAYRDTSTVLLFVDGPFRERLTREGVRVEVLDGGEALQSVRRESTWAGLRVMSHVMRLAWRISPARARTRLPARQLAEGVRAGLPRGAAWRGARSSGI